MARIGRGLPNRPLVRRGHIAVTTGLLTHVGSFIPSGAAGTQSFTGVGFQPKTVLFWANLQASDAISPTGTDMPMQIMGFATSSAQAAVADDDDFSGGDPHLDPARCISIDASGVAKVRATLTTLDVDGFTLNFSVVAGTSPVINYLALGGNDLSNVAIINGALPSSTGNVDYTGAGFQPDAAILLGGVGGNAFGGGSSAAGVGFIAGTSQRGAWSSTFDSTTGVARYQRNDKAYVEIGGTTLRAEADIVSFLSDGFRLNFTTAPSTGNLYALCLKGASFKVGSITQKTSTGTQSTTGIGFRPKALLFLSALQASSTTIDTNYLAAMIGGASSSSLQSVNAKTDNNNTTAILDRTKIFAAPDDSSNGNEKAAAGLSSFDSDGWTLNYTTADATAREIIYMAFGDAGVFPSSNVSYSARLTGQITSNVSYDARLTGQSSSNVAYDARLTGQNTSATSQDTRVTGQVSTSLATDARVTGTLGSNVAYDSRLTGKATSNTTYDARVTGQAISLIAFDARVSGTAGSNIAYDVRLTGQATSTVAYDARVKGQITTSVAYDARISAQALTNVTTDVRVTGQNSSSIAYGTRLTSSVGFPSTGVIDNFNRINNSTIGTDWDINQMNDSAGPPNIDSNQVQSGAQTYSSAFLIQYYGTATYGSGIYDGGVFGPDSEAYATIVALPTGTNASIGVQARIINPVTGSAGAYEAKANVQAGTWSISRYVSGVPTILTSGSQTWLAGDAIGLKVLGTGSVVTVIAYRQSSGVWDSLGLYYDNSGSRIITSGYIGFTISDPSLVNGHIDDFGGGTSLPGVVSVVSYDVRLTGQGSATNAAYATRITGQALSTVAYDSRLTGQAISSQAQDARIIGQITSSIGYDARLMGQANINAAYDSYITGQLSSSLAQDVRLFGQILSQKELDARLIGQLSSSYEIDSLIFGAGQSTSTIGVSIIGVPPSFSLLRPTRTRGYGNVQEMSGLTRIVRPRGFRRASRPGGYTRIG